MTPEYWIVVLGVVAVAAALTWIVLMGGRLRCQRGVRLICPNLGRPVECRILQDIRTGQWRQVLSCSAFEDPDALDCDRKCARVANLGFLQPHVGRAA
ncbi:MAG TPA: hypothetical protein VKA01_03270 [Vicinamibacteria bacterium]|nr:hypothetical protein [Vicinamibacteria bacterium]